MKRILMSTVLVLVVSFSTSGCSSRSNSSSYDNYFPKVLPTYAWKSNPPVQSVSNAEYGVEISPYDCRSETGRWNFNDGCKGMNLTIKNKTSEDIILIWDQTYFLDNNQTNGTFMFDGIVYKDRNNKKPNDIIFGNSVFKKVIFPNNRVSFAGRTWLNMPMKSGIWGAYLTLKNNGKIAHEKLTYSIYRE